MTFYIRFSRRGSCIRLEANQGKVGIAVHRVIGKSVWIRTRIVFPHAVVVARDSAQCISGVRFSLIFEFSQI